MNHKLLVVGGTDLSLTPESTNIATRINVNVLKLADVLRDAPRTAVTTSRRTSTISAVFFAPHSDYSKGESNRFTVESIECPSFPVAVQTRGETSEAEATVRLPYLLLSQRKDLDRRVRSLMHQMSNHRLIVHAASAGAMGWTLRDIATERSLPFVATHHEAYAEYARHWVTALVTNMRTDPRLNFSELTRQGGLLSDVFPTVFEDKELLGRLRGIVDGFRKSREHLIVRSSEGSRRWGRCLLATSQLLSRYAYNRVHGARAIAQVAWELDELVQRLLRDNDENGNADSKVSWRAFESCVQQIVRSLLYAYLRAFYANCEIVLAASETSAESLRQELGLSSDQVRVLSVEDPHWLRNFSEVNRIALAKGEKRVRRPRLKPAETIQFSEVSDNPFEPFASISDAHLGDDDAVDRAMALDALFGVLDRLDVSNIRYNGDIGDLSADPTKRIKHRDMFNRVRLKWRGRMPNGRLPIPVRASVAIPDLNTSLDGTGRKSAILRQLEKAAIRLGLEMEVNGESLSPAATRNRACRRQFDELFITGNHDEGLDPDWLLPDCQKARSLAHYDGECGAVFTHGHILGLPEFFEAIRSDASPHDKLAMLSEASLGQSLEYAAMFHDLATTVWRRSERYVNVRVLWKQTFQPTVSRLVRWWRLTRLETRATSHQLDDKDGFSRFVESTISPADDVQAAAEFARSIHSERTPCWISVYGHSHKDHLEKVKRTDSSGQERTTIVANSGKFHGKPITCLIARFPQAIIARWSKRDRVWRVHKRISLSKTEVEEILTPARATAPFVSPVTARPNGGPVIPVSPPIEEGGIICEVPTEGDGHITRFDALFPFYKERGPVCTIASGPRAETIELQGGVQYRCTGLALHYDEIGGVDRWRSASGNANRIRRVQEEAQELAPQLINYQHIISDYGPTLKLAHTHAIAQARRSNRLSSLPPLLSISHQAALDSRQLDVPRPTEPACGQTDYWIGQQAIDLLRGDRNIGFHYEAYNDHIFPPLIRPSIIENSADFDGEFVLVYLRGSLEKILATLNNVDLDVEWRIYGRQIERDKKLANGIWACPRDRQRFADDLMHCVGLFADCGFGLSAEALHFGIPFVGRPGASHFEQQCNAAALEEISDVGIVYDFDSQHTCQVLRDIFGAALRDRRRLTRYGRTGEIRRFDNVAQEAAKKIFGTAPSRIEVPA